jgi:hypothetical protein
MNYLELIELLLANGYDHGWTLQGEILTQWEHDQDPPAPLTRPEATNETPSPA